MNWWKLPARVDREIDEELRFHLEEEIEAGLRAGLTADQARQAAYRSLGGTPHRVKEACRDVRRASWIDSAASDLRFAWRGLRRAKGFTAAAVLTLAVGIAGTTVMFALIHGVLLRRLPVAEEERLVVAWRQPSASNGFHAPFAGPRPIGDTGRVYEGDVAVIARENRVFERVGGVSYNGAIRSGVVEDDSAAVINASAVTGNFFSVIGISPVLGRSLTDADDVRGAENVLVLSNGLWRRRYAGSPDAIGRRLVLNQRPFAIVGVMPPDLDYPRGTEAWLSVAALNSTSPNPSFVIDLDLVGRLRPGVTVAQAASELQRLIASIEENAGPDVAQNIAGGARAVVRPFREVVVGDVRTAMVVLFGAVALVLLIASANVANLLLLRGEARRTEMAVRAALGAGRGRLTSQLLIEGLLLALAAGVVALIAARWAIPGLLAMVPDGLPRPEAVAVSPAVILFAIVVAALTAALAVLAPALSVVRTDLTAHLRQGGRGGTAAHRGRRALVVAQVGLTVMVVAAAGLLVRTLLQLQNVDMGLAVERLVFVPLDLPQGKYLDRTRHLQFLDDVEDELTRSPDIASVTAVAVAPFAGARGWDVPVFIAEGQREEDAEANPALNLESVLPSYFRTLEIPLTRGRAFTNMDRQGTPEVAIVSADVAARLWPGGDPIGRRLKIGPLTSDFPWLTVVGVAERTRYRDLQEPRPTLYVPAQQFIVAANMLVVRTSAPLPAIAGIVRTGVRGVDPDVQVMRVAPFEELLAAPLARPRFQTFLLGVFASAALLLAAIGLYGVVAASVRQRYTEIGVRVALGATAGQVRSLVLGEGLTLTGIGVGLGLAGAFAATRVMQGMLYEVSTFDPAAMFAAVFVLLGVAAVACFVPARHAARLDPVVTLRSN